jgi:AraC-like DNA-binding protein
VADRIVELLFKSSVRPELSFEIMKFSQLLERPLAHPLDALTRPTFFLIYYGLKGRTLHRVDFERCPIEQHDVAVVVPGRVQAFDPAPGMDMWMVLFTPEFLQLSADPRSVDPLRGAQSLSPFWTRPVTAVPPAARGDLLALIEQLNREYQRSADVLQTPLLSSLLRAFLLLLERTVATSGAQANAPPQLELFRDTLERRHAETRSVEDYARAAGVTPRSLNALTRRHFGASAKQTIDARVVLELKRLLAHTDLSVKELAARFGFDEPTNLVKFFRLHVRQTPVQFREAFRGPAAPLVQSHR